MSIDYISDEKNSNMTYMIQFCKQMNGQSTRVLEAHSRLTTWSICLTCNKHIGSRKYKQYQIKKISTDVIMAWNHLWSHKLCKTNLTNIYLVTIVSELLHLFGYYLQVKQVITNINLVTNVSELLHFIWLLIACKLNK
jgi:hypothetical protein